MSPVVAVENEELNTFVDHAAVGMAVVGAEGEIHRSNRSLSLLLGIEREELQGRRLVDLVHPSSRIKIERALETLQDRSRTSVVEEARCIHDSGKDVWVVLSATVVRRDHDRPARSVVQLLDITPRRTIEPALAESTLLWRSILDSANYSVIATTPEGTIREFNAAASRMLGYTREEVVGRTSPEIFHLGEEVVARAAELSAMLGEDIEPGFDVFVRQTLDGQVDEREWTYVRKDGSRFTVLLSVTPLRNAKGEILGFLGIGSDISEKKRLGEEISRSRAYLEAVLEHVGVGIVLCDPAGRVAVTNRSFTQNMGIPPNAALGRSREELWDLGLQRFDAPKIREAMMQSREGQMDLELEKPSHRVYRWTTQRIPLQDGDGQLDVYRDVTSEVDLARLREQHSITDPLTGLVNRRGALEAMRREVARARRHGHPICVAFVDVDHFKKVNDTYGHAVGDRVLVAIADTLTSSVRREDVVARWGGEEILLVLPDVNLEQATQLADRARENVATMAHPELPPVTVSVGVAQLGVETDAIEAGVANADMKLYEAKNAGRNCVR